MGRSCAFICACALVFVFVSVVVFVFVFVLVFIGWLLWFEVTRKGAWFDWQANAKVSTTSSRAWRRAWQEEGCSAFCFVLFQNLRWGSGCGGRGKEAPAVVAGGWMM